MALRATIYKAELNVADNDRAYYGSHTLTLARHPSETEERLMVRLLAYGLYAQADEALSFSRGLSDSDEPALWEHDLGGNLLHWLEVGLPDDRRLIKASGRADKVTVLAYGRNVSVWWSGIKDKISRARNIQVYALDAAGTDALAALAERGMTINLNIQDGTVWASSDKGEATIEVSHLNAAA
ncbi:YaeQ family protein [Alcaligenes phenolicus]|uniref:YaeQ family protein n=1 Tax=Alcaligenes phenolicus TaxID=232846 RepID=UPI002AA7B8C1|nr:YaeQ family protein [Alcaligenes phenolicus]